MSNTVLYEQERHGVNSDSFSKIEGKHWILCHFWGWKSVKGSTNSEAHSTHPRGNLVDRRSREAPERVHGGRSHSPTVLHDEKCRSFLLSRVPHHSSFLTLCLACWPMSRENLEHTRKYGYYQLLQSRWLVKGVLGWSLKRPTNLYVNGSHLKN